MESILKNIRDDEDILISGEKMLLSEYEKELRELTLDSIELNSSVKQLLENKTHEEKLFIINFCGISLNKISKWFFPCFEAKDYLLAIEKFQVFNLKMIDNEKVDLDELRVDFFEQYFDDLLAFYHAVKYINMRVLFLLTNKVEKAIPEKNSIDTLEFMNYANKEERFIFPSEYNLLLEENKNQFIQPFVDDKISDVQLFLKIYNDTHLSEKERYDLIEKLSLTIFFQKLRFKLIETPKKIKVFLDHDFLMFNFFKPKTLTLDDEGAY